MTDLWQPITLAEMEALVAEQLGNCTPGHQAVFAALRVPFYRMPLHRLGLIEPVWVVAHVAEGLLYFEDVEAGFEIGAPGDDGALPARGCNQFELTHILHRLAHAGLSRQR